MSNEIDDKIVSLEFDNSKFNKPAEDSMGVLDKLKASFTFKGISKGFDELNRSIKKVTLQPIVSGVDTVYAKFTFFERFTIQMYDRMANKIINTGKRIANETFIAPVKTGKTEYELKMGSIQTIMASTGESLDVVNQKLNELNKYSDDTIYSFKDMTDNIGKFTNAGIKLEDAVMAIKGVANEAALSGASAAEASRAMYNFSQALSSGYVKLIDWKSIENANMATKSFKEELLKTALAVGTVTDAGNGFYKTTKGKMISATQGFNDSLADAWMTTDVLTKTLQNYADDETEIGKKAKAAATEVKTLSMMVDTLQEALQSGWAETWENVIGDFEEAKALWTGVSNVLGGLIDRMSNARNSLLRLWKEIGGRTALLNAFKNAWYNLSQIMGAIKDAFRSVFPPLTAQRLAEITRRFENLTLIMQPSYKQLDQIERTFKGLFSVLGIITDALSAFKNAMTPVIMKIFPRAVNGALGATASFGDMLVALRKTIKEGKFFETFFGKVANIFEAMVTAFQKIFSVIKKTVLAFKNGGITEGIKAIGDGIVDIVSSAFDYVKNLNVVKKIRELGGKIADTVRDWPILGGIIKAITSIKDWLVNTNVFSKCVEKIESFVASIQDKINGFRKVDTKPVGEFTENVTEKFSAIDKVKNFFSKVWSVIISVFETVGPTIKKIGSYIGSSFKQMFDGIVKIFKNSDLADVGALFAGGGLGAVLGAMAKFIFDLSGAVGNSKKFLQNVNEVLGSVTKLLNAMVTEIHAKSIKQIAVSVAILAGALFVLAAIPVDSITQGLVAITLLFRGLVSTMNSFNSIGAASKDSKGVAGVMLSMGSQILMIALAVGVLIANLAILAFIPYEPMVKGIAVILFLMRGLTRELANLRASDGVDVKMAGTIIAFGMALKAIAKAMLLLALIDSKGKEGTLLHVTVSIAALIALMGIVFTALAAVSKEKVSAAPIFAMAFVVGAIAYAISVIAVTAALIDDTSKLKTAVQQFALALSVVGAIMIILVGLTHIAADKHGQVAPATFVGLAVSILAISAAIMAIVGGVAILSLLPKDKLEGATDSMTQLLLAVTLVLGATIGILAVYNAFKSKTKKSLKVTLSGIVGLVGTILVITGAVAAMSAAALVASKANQKGLDWVLMSVGIITAIVLAMSALTGKFKALQEGVNVISRLGTALSLAFLGFGIGLFAFAATLDMLSDMSDEQVEKVGDSLASLSKVVSKRKSEIVDGVSNFFSIVIAAAIQSLNSMATSLTTGVMRTVIDILDSVIKNGPEMAAKLFAAVLIILAELEKKIGDIVEHAVRLVIKFVDAVAKSIDEHQTEIVDAIYRLFDAVASVMTRLFGRMFGVTGEVLDEFVNEWKGAVRSVIALFAAGALINKIVDFGKKTKASVKTMVAAFKELKNGIWYAREAIKEFGSASNAINAGMLEGASTAGKFALAIAKWGAKASVAVGAAKLLALTIDQVTKSMTVVSKADAQISDTYNRAIAKQNEYNQKLKERKEAATILDIEQEGTEKLADKLNECVDANSRIKDGYEEQLTELLPSLEEKLGYRFEIEGNQLYLLDEELKRYEYQADAVDKIIQKKRLQQQLESMEEEYTSAKAQLEDPETIKELNAAKAKMESDIELYNSAAEKAAIARNRYDAAIRGEAFEGTFFDIGAAESMLQQANSEYLDAQLQADASTKLYLSVKRNYEGLESLIQNYDEAGRVLIEGSAQDMQEMTYILSEGIQTASTNIVDVFSDYTELVSEYEEVQKEYEAAGKEIPKHLRERYETAIRVTREYLDKMGAYVNEMGGLAYAGDHTVEAGFVAAARRSGERIYNEIYNGAEVALSKHGEDWLKNVVVKQLNPVPALEEELIIGSPSKAMERLFGYVMEGAVIGTENGAPELINSAKTAAMATLFAFQNTLDDPLNRPTIVPMYDTSAIQNGSMLRNWDRSVNVGAMSAQLAASIDVDSIVASNEAAVEELTSLRQEVQELKSLIGNLKIYLDKRTLVGQLAPEMDAALGAITEKRGKGV